jgi:hypothetical protein
VASSVVLISIELVSYVINEWVNSKKKKGKKIYKYIYNNQRVQTCFICINNHLTDIDSHFNKFILICNY